MAKDDAKAFYWANKAAQQGDFQGQSMMGAMYADGIGVSQDLVLAYAWLNIAATTGEGNVKKMRDIIEKEMTPAEITEAQKISSAWKPGQKLERNR